MEAQPHTMTQTPAALPGSNLEGARSLDRWVYEHLEMVLIAIVLALVLKFFAIEAYQIPTGSMAPKLLGLHRHVSCPRCGMVFNVGLDSEENNGGKVSAPPLELEATCPNCRMEDIRIEKLPVISGNKILVNKFIYDLPGVKPKRWEVIVFRAPPWLEEDKNYIKRLVGFSGEIIDIRFGDIWIDGKISPKPKSVQDSVWIPVYDSGVIQEKSNRWSQWKPNGGFTQEGGKFSCTAGTAFLVYKDNIQDDEAYNSSSRSGYADLEVPGDYRLRFRFHPEKNAKGRLTVKLGENLDFFLLHIDMAGKKARVKVEQYPDLEKYLLLEKDIDLQEENEVLFSNPDNLLELEINGEKLLNRIEYATRDFGNGKYDSSHIEFEARDLTLALSDIRIDRDLHYRQGDFYDTYRGGRAKLDEANKAGETFYFALGDNSPKSRDGRDWGQVPADNLIGRAVMTFWPLKKEGWPWIDFDMIKLIR